MNNSKLINTINSCSEEHQFGWLYWSLSINSQLIDTINWWSESIGRSWSITVSRSTQSTLALNNTSRSYQLWSTWSTVSWLIQSTVVLKNTRWLTLIVSIIINQHDWQLVDQRNQLLHWRTPVHLLIIIDQHVNSQSIDTINSCTEEHWSVVSTINNQHAWQSVNRRNRLLQRRTPVRLIDHYQSTLLTVSWSTQSTLALKNISPLYQAWSIDMTDSHLTDQLLPWRTPRTYWFLSVCWHSADRHNQLLLWRTPVDHFDCC